MKLIFIRHGEPDYSIDSLTEKGWREAELLAQRTAKWNVTDFYCSPLGRARDTAACTLKKIGREAVTLDWLREFDAPIWDDMMKRRKVPWDFYPEFMAAHPELFDLHRWQENSVMAEGTVGKEYLRVCQELDQLLADYGYVREGFRYRTSSQTQKNAVVACFCHLGITCALLSHLINTTPSQLWQGFFLAPTSVTVIGTEERTPEEAYFRCQVMGDTSHLLMGGEPVSYYGYFTDPFQG
ncbi:MAG: histidine phosphatase family protein [Lachnospiraceae bacterium]|nr:histidine phosphatase family protein [Lachnospiraceae bacterium]